MAVYVPNSRIRNGFARFGVALHDPARDCTILRLGYCWADRALLAGSLLGGVVGVHVLTIWVAEACGVARGDEVTHCGC